MRKGLIKFLAGIGFVFGVSSSSAQSIDYVFRNKDKDDFSEEVVGVFYKVYKGVGDGTTYVGFYDEDGDNRYEHIRIINGDNSHKVLIEDFYLDSIRMPDFYGFLDYSIKGYHLDKKTFDKYFFKKNPERFLKMKDFKWVLAFSENFKDLNNYDLKKNKMFLRFESLLNGFVSREDFEALLRKERALEKQIIKRTGY